MNIFDVIYSTLHHSKLYIVLPKSIDSIKHILILLRYLFGVTRAK
jgi:hypothetical protein